MTEIRGAVKRLVIVMDSTAVYHQLVNKQHTRCSKLS